jgi:hypothetical protein
MQHGKAFPSPFLLIGLLCATIALCACSGGSSGPAVPPEPPKPRFALTPAVVRISDTENLIVWEMAEGKVYSLYWSRKAGGADRPVRIDGVTSPYVHTVPDNQQPIYYSLSDQDTRPGPEGFSVVFEQRPIARYILLAVGDADQDGCVEIIGTRNDCAGNLQAMDDDEIGLETLTANGRNYRDARLADFDGDGIPDLVSNSYNPFGPDAPVAQLHRGMPDGRFRLDESFLNLGAKGYGETIVVADFDNDNDLDIYLPYYSYEHPDEKSYLLINDGHGTFRDVADEAGVAERGIPAGLRVEGVQAIDVDWDGDIDLAAASKLYLNRLMETGKLVFEDSGKFPVGFDEGLQFLDWNNDGRFDVIKIYPYDDVGPQLYENDGNGFVLREGVFPPGRYNFAYGLNSYDVNNDGLVDVVASGGRIFNAGERHYPVLLINTGTKFERHQYASTEFSFGNDISAFADLDGSGTVDMISRYGPGMLFLNRARSFNFIIVRLVGPNGEYNQHGRVLRVRSTAHPERTMARFVDSGSGYLANNQYDILIGLPYLGSYEVEAVFRGGITRKATVSAGYRLVMSENGVVSIQPVLPRGLRR